jgi:hypothetical protein
MQYSTGGIKGASSRVETNGSKARFHALNILLVARVKRMYHQQQSEIAHSVRCACAYRK